MSVFTITGTVASIKNGFAFVQTENGSVFVPPHVCKLHSADLVVGAEVEICFDDEVWSERKQDFTSVASEIYRVTAPEVHVVMCRAGWFDPKKKGGILTIVGDSEFGNSLWVSKEVVDNAGFKFGRKMPIKAAAVRVGDKMTVIGIETGRDLLDDISAIEAAAESSDEAAPESVADISEEDLAEIAEMPPMTEESAAAAEAEAA